MTIQVVGDDELRIGSRGPTAGRDRVQAIGAVAVVQTAAVGVIGVNVPIGQVWTQGVQ